MSSRPPRRHTRLLSAVALATATLIALTGCGSSSKDAKASSAAGDTKTGITLRIPDPGNNGVLALGKKDGSLDAALAKVGAKVSWTGSAGPFAPAAQAINAGQLDVALGSITSAVAALGQKPSFKLFGATAPDLAGEGILVKSDSKIHSIRDLVGKKVACSQGGTSEYLLLAALEQAGIPADKVERVYLRADQTAPVFAAGQVDAWATWATYSVPALASGNARFLADGRALGSDNYSVWAVRNAFADKHPEVVKAFYAYLHEAGTKEIADPAAYINVFTDSGPTAYGAEPKRIQTDFTRQGATVEPIRPADVERFGKVAQFFLNQKVTPSLVDVKPHLLDVASLAGATG
ncbi:ABC transporter substrate-binding protein [Embleya sp. NPDC050154]|uniref:ABC transporter substrate-binding protein n=1 Tax=unclassified Embleya TaxID=2699296 RepID=UPI0037966098